MDKSRLTLLKNKMKKNKLKQQIQQHQAYSINTSCQEEEDKDRERESASINLKTLHDLNIDTTTATLVDPDINATTDVDTNECATNINTNSNRARTNFSFKHDKDESKSNYYSSFLSVDGNVKAHTKQPTISDTDSSYPECNPIRNYGGMAYRDRNKTMNTSPDNVSLVIKEKGGIIKPSPYEARDRNYVNSNRQRTSSFQAEHMKNSVNEICGSTMSMNIKSPASFFDDNNNNSNRYPSTNNNQNLTFNHNIHHLNIMNKNNNQNVPSHFDEHNTNTKNLVLSKKKFSTSESQQQRIHRSDTSLTLPIEFHHHQSNKVIKKKQLAWVCNTCDKECIPIRSESRCLCGHRLKEHDETQTDNTNGKGIVPCKHPKCKCKNFYFIVADGAWILRCQCKHKHTDHDPTGKDHPCLRNNCKCKSFFSPWVCNCDHPWSAHKQILREKIFDPSRLFGGIDNLQDLNAVPRPSGLSQAS